ncbi:MAG: DUF4115 domain-containing protein [Anaerolineae bacterium]|nr:DUF4115 domain-containing protein [Anaerolineae bacterium]
MEVEILGSELRAARLQKELSLEEVEQELRIRAKFLRAIEVGDYSLLPSQVQARGFLRNYAVFLGLDSNVTLARYEQAMSQLDGDGPNGHLPKPTPVVVAKPSETPYPGERAPNLEGVYATEVSQPRRRRAPFSSNLVLVLVASLMLMTAMALGGAQFVEALIAADRNADAGVDGFIDQILGDQPTVTPSATLAPQASPTPPGVEISAVQPSADSVLVIFNVTQRTWMRVTVDGAVSFEGIVAPGERVQYQGSETVNVRAGNGAGLDATINGQALGPIGERGELVDMTFTRDFPGPAFTAEATPPAP